jgi:hypothetical protein
MHHRTEVRMPARPRTIARVVALLSALVITGSVILAWPDGPPAP